MHYFLEIIGYISALFIGFSLGMIGGGGSILTVPILVYLFRISPVLATSYSLFIVGMTSLAGSVNNFGKGAIKIRTIILFGLPSMTTIILIRKIILPSVAPTIYLGTYKIAYETLTMILFGVIMISSSFFMIRGKKRLEEKQNKNWFINASVFYGILIGLVTGFLGAGGGFLLIPALVILLDVEMKKAIATSLFLIAINSLIGFAGDIGHFATDWRLVGFLSIIAISGVLIGRAVNKKMENDSLRKGFGFFILCVGILILIKESLNLILAL